MSGLRQRCVGSDGVGWVQFQRWWVGLDGRIDGFRWMGRPWLSFGGSSTKPRPKHQARSVSIALVSFLFFFVVI